MRGAASDLQEKCNFLWKLPERGNWGMGTVLKVLTIGAIVL